MSVSNQCCIIIQITEVREWFKAFVNEDSSERNYTEHFKPVLCYLEGAWTISPQDTIDESFESDRHFIDASSWLDLQQKVNFEHSITSPTCCCLWIVLMYNLIFCFNSLRNILDMEVTTLS